MRSHGLFGLGGIARGEACDNGTVLVERLDRASGPKARPETVDPHDLVKILGQDAEEPLVLTRSGDPQMEILIPTRLVVGLARGDLGLLGMTTQTAVERLDLRIGNPLGGKPAGHALKRLAQLEQAAQILKREIDDACAEMGGARRKPLRFEPKDGLAGRPAADAKTQSNVVFADRAAGSDIAEHNGLDDPIINLIGQRQTFDWDINHTVNCIQFAEIVNAGFVTLCSWSACPPRTEGE